MELPEEVQERIRAEEIFRHEVQRHLEKPRTWWNTIRAFFETQLGGFFLTTGVVGLAMWLYTDFLLPRKEKVAQREQLTTEIAFRVSTARRNFKPPDTNEPLKYLYAEPGVPYIYPEFHGRPLVSLLGELDTLDYDWPANKRFDGFVVDLSRSEFTAQELANLLDDIETMLPADKIHRHPTPTKTP